MDPIILIVFFIAAAGLGFVNSDNFHLATAAFAASTAILLIKGIFE